MRKLNMEQILRGLSTFENEENVDQIVLAIYGALDKAAVQVQELRAGRKEKIAQRLEVHLSRKLNYQSVMTQDTCDTQLLHQCICAEHHESIKFSFDLKTWQSKGSHIIYTREGIHAKQEMQRTPCRQKPRKMQ